MKKHSIAFALGAMMIAVGTTANAQSTDYSTAQNNYKNQIVVTLSDNSKKYYNTEDINSIDIDNAKATFNSQGGGSYTFNGNINLLAFAKAVKGNVVITEAKGWQESAYVKFEKFTGANTYNVYVKGGQYAEYTKIDDQLVRDYGSYGRADIVGLKASADYSIRVVPVNDSKVELTANASVVDGISVVNYSREGFAHKTWTKGIGAYNDDGTLKAGARVLYVTKNTAKTIKVNVTTDSKGGVTECVGMQAIIAGYEKGIDTTPITFRIIGMLTADDMDSFGSSEEGIQIKGKKADSELNITIEGIGDDATIGGFGFLVRNSKSVEFRNFGIMRCKDDGISLDTDNSNIWIHNIDVFYGKHGSGDHAKGDGAIDVKSDSKYVTLDYCHFWDTGKSNMFGMKSESGPNYITYHHNWFDHSDSRHPRVRTMSVHVYNNYFDNVAKYGVGATSGASVFVENNYFLKTKKPILSSLQGTDAQGSGTFSGENGGMIKAYGNYFDRTATNFKYYTQANAGSDGYDAYETATRSSAVPETEVTKVGATGYNNFDTDASLMYAYTPDAAADVPAVVTGYYGAGRLNHGDFSYTFKDNVGNDDTDSEYDTVLASMLDSYKSSLVGIFGDENIDSGNPSDTKPGDDNQQPQTGEVFGTFDGEPSNNMFTVVGDYGDGKITYNDVYYKKGVKLNSKGSITFTPSQDVKMTIVLATAKSGRNVKVNGSQTTVGGTENTAGAYYELEPITLTGGTQYVLAKGSEESIVMIVKLTPTAE